jgi:hypothetical protein
MNGGWDWQEGIIPKWPYGIGAIFSIFSLCSQTTDSLIHFGG